MLLNRTLPCLISVGLLAALVTLTSANTSAQYALDQQVSFVHVDGTSTLHDWRATARKLSGSMQAEVVSQHIVKMESASISVPVECMKTEKESMDENMYEALKSKKYPQIQYRLNSNTIHNGTITVCGELTIAGVTKPVRTTVTQKDAGNYIKIDGKVELKMSDFNVQPPEFLFGAFKTGDEITVSFNFMFSKNP